MIRPLEPTFAGRVRETTCLVGGLAFLALLSRPNPQYALNFALGVGLGLLVWWSAQRLVTAYDAPPRRFREAWPLAGWYLGKYAVAVVGLGLFARLGALEPLSFTAGFSLPTLVVLLKAFGLTVLGPEAEPAPVYSVDRKAARRD